MTISPLSSSAALSVTAALSTHTRELSSSLERLSSGLRINSAKDDVGGLAAANKFQAESKVYAQAVRNVSNGISALNIADAATVELNNLLERMRELALQSSNSNTTSTQRAALSEEFEALQEEYERIESNTEFNGNALLNGSFGTRTIAAGEKEIDQISVSIGNYLQDLEMTVSTTTGDGTFATGVTTSTFSHTGQFTTGDINGDGREDILIGTGTAATTVGIMFGNGDGSFTSALSLDTGYSANQSVELIDVDNDNDLDVVALSALGVATGEGSVFLNDGTGSFGARISFDVLGDSFATGMVLADFDEDGYVDIVSGDSNSGTFSINFGNGDGSFQTASTLGGSIGVETEQIVVGDINEDGDLDILATGRLDDVVQVFLGDGTGSFSAMTSFGNAVDGIRLADFDEDGHLDVVTDVGSAIGVYLGDGAGNFGAVTTFAATAAVHEIDVADIDGDGNLDVAAAINTGTAVNVFLGDGTGNFATAVSYQEASEYVRIADFDGDGFNDLLAHTGGDMYALSQDTTTTTTIQDLDISSESNAGFAATALSTLIDGVEDEIVQITASLGRLESTLSLTSSIRDSLEDAADRITNIDVADETASFVKAQVKQESATAIFAQANLQPSTVVDLLNETFG